MSQQKIRLVNGKFVVEGEVKKEPIKLSKEKPGVKEYSEEVLLLRDRVILGNQKLFDAWKRICTLDHESQEWRDEFERWHQATKKLGVLCYNLQGGGYEDCLYIKYYKGLTMEEEGVIMEEISKGKVTEVPGGVRTKNCLKNPDGFWCQVCPSIYPYWQEDVKGLLFEEKEEK